MSRELTLGKIDPHILQKFFSSLPKDSSVIVGPGIGEDAAVIRTDNRLIAVKTDPITFTSQNAGWYVVNINANDIACMGATPRWILVNLLLPPGEKEDLLQHFFNQLSDTCRNLGVQLIGGHTEVTPAVKKPIAVGCMVGSLMKNKIISNSRAQPGDIILLTKGLAIEGTHVIYQEKKRELKEKIPVSFLNRIKGFLNHPGISVVKEATLATSQVDVHCMHDPTEGGLMAGLWEIATASGVGIEVDPENIFVFEETNILCQEFGLNPLALLASGALIIVLPPEEAARLVSIYNRTGIRCMKIGKIVQDEKTEKINIITKKEVTSITEPPKEELNKIFT